MAESFHEEKLEQLWAGLGLSQNTSDEKVN